MLSIHCLPAIYGDSFFVKSHDANICFLVDCGYKKTYFNEIKKLTNEVDFLILTHVDEDHIFGAFPLIADYPEKFNLNKVYLNTPDSIEIKRSLGNISVGQSIELEKVLNCKGISYDSLLQGDELSLSENCKLSIISPSKGEVEVFNEKYKIYKERKDIEIPISLVDFEEHTLEELSTKKDSYKTKLSDFVNAASIAFILEYNEKKVLFLGDAHPLVITDYLCSMGYSTSNKCYFDYVKLSHHGSIFSISHALISMISCSKYIISTNGGRAKSKHPSKETIAKIAVNGCRGSEQYITFYFNYPILTYESRNGSFAAKSELEKYKIKFVHSNKLVLG